MLSLKCFFQVNKVDMILVQETMSCNSLVVEFFLKKFSGWEIFVLDAFGLFGGLLAICNHSCVDFTPYHSPTSILLSGKVRGFQHEVKFVNCYAPYHGREKYSNQIISSGIF